MTNQDRVVGLRLVLCGALALTACADDTNGSGGEGAGTGGGGSGDGAATAGGAPPTGGAGGGVSSAGGGGSTAQPGECVHGQSFEVMGAGFGQKAIAAPFVWDDCSGADPASKWDIAWPLSTYTANPGAYRSASNGVGLPHDNITKYYSAGADDDWHSGTFMVMKGDVSQGGTYPYYVYASWYHRYDPAWVFDNNGAEVTNFKQFDFTRGYGGYDLPNNWYGEYRGGDLEDEAALPKWHLNDDTFEPALGVGSVYADEAPNPISDWVKTEVEIKADPSDGFVKVYDNNVLVVEYEGRTDNYPDPEGGRSFGFGGYTNQWGHGTNWAYMADMYLDETVQRLVLADAPDIAQASVVEPQPPTSWADGAIEATCNKGKLQSGTVYAFVRRDDLTWVSAGTVTMH